MNRQAARHVAFAALVLIAASGPRCSGGYIPRFTPRTPSPMRTPTIPPKTPIHPEPPIWPQAPGRPAPRVDPPPIASPPKIRLNQKIPIPLPPSKVPVVEPPGTARQANHKPGTADWPAMSQEVEAALATTLLNPTVKRELLAARTRLSSLKPLGELHDELAAGDFKKINPELVEQLPEPIQRPLRGLLGLKDLGADLTRPWVKAPDSAVLARRLNDVHEATGSAQLTATLKGALITKAEREGHPTLARALRDVKLEDVPVNSASRAPAPPPVPEAPPGTLPGQYESVWKGLPELRDPATKASRQLYQSVTAQLGFQQSLTLSQAQLALHLNRLIGSQDRKEKEERRTTLTGVRTSLGRPLTPSERIIAADMIHRGKEAAAVTAELKRTLRDRMLSRPPRVPTGEFPP
jgi:hypothetical protein